MRGMKLLIYMIHQSNFNESCVSDFIEVEL